MEAAQLLRTWLTDWRQSFAKWALFRHTTEVFKDFATRASIEAKPQYGTKWRLLAQYFRPLLTNQHQNFTMLALFGQTLQVSED